jgi:hypothetical protein
MKYIYLNSSGLAKLTGHNKYEPLEKVVNEILSKNGIQERYVPKSNVEGSIHGLSEEKLSGLKVELGLPKDATTAFIEAAIKALVMKDAYSASLSESESKAKVDDKLTGKPILQSIEVGIKQDLRMRRGNIKENANLNTIQKKIGKAVTHRNSRMYSKELYRSDKYVLVVRGKIDGITDEVIIESKNRTRCLFKELRGYEQVQLEAYMFLTGFENALLTEHYNEESCEIPYVHDEEFWSSCIDSIVTFIETHIAEFIK